MGLQKIVWGISTATLLSLSSCMPDHYRHRSMSNADIGTQQTTLKKDLEKDAYLSLHLLSERLATDFTPEQIKVIYATLPGSHEEKTQALLKIVRGEHDATSHRLEDGLQAHADVSKRGEAYTALMAEQPVGATEQPIHLGDAQTFLEHESMKALDVPEQVEEPISAPETELVPPEEVEEVPEPFEEPAPAPEIGSAGLRELVTDVAKGFKELEERITKVTPVTSSDMETTPQKNSTLYIKQLASQRKLAVYKTEFTEIIGEYLATLTGDHEHDAAAIIKKHDEKPLSEAITLVLYDVFSHAEKEHKRKEIELSGVSDLLKKVYEEETRYQKRENSNNGDHNDQDK
jgi:hypothetical protein